MNEVGKIILKFEFLFQGRIQDVPLERGANLQGGHFSAKMYAKTKELGPVGWGARARGALWI